MLSLQAAQRLADKPGIRLRVLGGESRPSEHSLASHLTQRMLDELWFDTFVMSVGGVHRELGWSEFSLGDVTVKQHVRCRSTKAIVIADSTKLGVRTFTRVADLNDVAIFVTDEPGPGTASETRTDIRDAGVEVVPT